MPPNGDSSGKIKGKPRLFAAKMSKFSNKRKNQKGAPTSFSQSACGMFENSSSIIRPAAVSLHSERSRSSGIRLLRILCVCLALTITSSDCGRFSKSGRRARETRKMLSFFSPRHNRSRSFPQNNGCLPTAPLSKSLSSA